MLWLYIGRVTIKGFHMKHKLGSIQSPFSPSLFYPLLEDKVFSQQKLLARKHLPWPCYTKTKQITFVQN